MSPDDALRQHKKYCRWCTPRWETIDMERVLTCGIDGSLIWWPGVDISLSPDQYNAMFILLPMMYDDDSEGVEQKLRGMGIYSVTPKNFRDTMARLSREYEKQLWEDNIGKQLLGRIMEDD